MDQLLNICGPRIIDVPNTADGSLTRASIKGITPDELVALEALGVGELQMIYAQMTRARMTGVRENNLHDLVMSKTVSAKRGLTKQSLGQRSFFLPYMLEEQEDFVNVSAFVVNSGQASPSAGTTVGGIVYPTHAWDIVVANSPSPFASAIKYIERYFLPESYVTVLNLSGGGAAQEPYFKVINSVNVNADTAKVTPEKAILQPTDGVVQIGVNSISDYESYCRNHPAELSKRIIDFWYETNRYTESYDDITKEYLDYIKSGKVNEYLDRFRTLDMTEYNKRQYANYQKNFLNDFFFGQQINEFQTVELYQQLPKVTGKLGEFIEYKCKALGVKELLRRCNRVIDKAGNPLDLNQLETLLTTIRRRREVSGGNVREIDLMCGHEVATMIDQVMMGYYKANNRVEFQQSFEPKKIADGHLWDYKSYDMPKARVKLNVIYEPFFDDYAEHFTGGLANRGNSVWILDWSDIKHGVAASGSRNASTPDLMTDPTLACTIKTNVMHHRLESTLRTVILEDPSLHLIIENFSLACPTYNYALCSPTAL
jgi:hypothetical protein